MSLDQGKMMIAYDRKRTSTLTLDEQPGAHTGATRQYIHGYSDSNIVYLNTASGNDSNDGSTELLAKLTYASAATAAGSTKKIRVVNDGAALSTNITKPTEMKRVVSGTISSSLTAPVDTWTQAGTLNGLTGKPYGVVWAPWLSKFFAVGGSGKLYASTDGNVWSAVAEHGFGSDTPQCVCVSEKNKTIFIAGNAKVGSSSDGVGFTVISLSASIAPDFRGAWFDDSTDTLLICGNYGMLARSTDLAQSFSVTILDAASYFYGVTFGNGKWVVAAPSGVYVSSEGVNWQFVGITSTVNVAVAYSNLISKFLLGGIGGTLYLSSDASSWTAASSPPSLSPTQYIYGFAESLEIQQICLFGSAGLISFSSDGDSWTDAATPSFGSTDVYSGAYSPLLGKFSAVGAGAAVAYSTAFANTISASVAGFSIQAVQYSGTPTLYNCTLRNPGTAAAVSLNGCRVNYGAEIDADSGTHRATLFIGDTYFTTTPASQNAFSLNSNTFGGKCYILNSSQTGYEQIRDNLFADGIDATWPVTVSGRDNVQGVSSNALFGFEVTFNDPKFVDETDYTLQYQTNGYARNSLAAGRSNIYYNSAGGRRDIGAWSYVESAVSYYHAKTAYISKPTKISVTYEETVSEQQGDNGPVSVYTKPSRVKEILTLVYDVTEAVDRAIFDYIRTLRDKGVKVQLFPEWGMNGSTVTVNGNQSAGVEFLTIDAAQVFNGLFLTIAGERYYVLRASPNNTAATKLILDRPLESNVSDNDVITTNYPPGAGEYQFSPPPQLTLEYVDPDTLLTFMRGQTLRFVREWSP